MNRVQEKIFIIVKQQASEILPNINAEDIDPNNSLKDYGANSLDRAEIVVNSMAQLGIKFPLNELSDINNIQSLINFFESKLK